MTELQEKHQAKDQSRIFFIKFNTHFKTTSLSRGYQSKAKIYQKRSRTKKKQKSKLEEEEQKRRAETTRKSTDLETDLQLLCAQKEKAVVDADFKQWKNS